MASVDVGQDFGDTDISGRAYGVILASIICPSIALLFVAGRLLARYWTIKTLRFDDYLAVLTLFSNIAYSVIQGLATQPYIGIGRQQNSFGFSEESAYYQWVYIFDTLYIASLLGYKTTILCLYLRVFGVRRQFRWICLATLFVIAGYLVAALFIQLLGCNPPHKFWDMYVEGSCVDYKRFDIAYGCLNVITDLILTILPIREIWRLYMPVKEKFWASLIFGSAILAFGAAMVSQVYRFHDLFSEDRTYRAAVTFVWQTIEINTGLMCSCTPILRPLYRRTAEKFMATFHSSRSSTTAEQIARQNLEREVKGKSFDSATTASPDSAGIEAYKSDVEKADGPPALDIGRAVSRTTTRDGAHPPSTRRIPSDIYMSPLPSATEAERQRTREADELALANASALRELDEASRGRRTEEKPRHSQAELEEMLRQANQAKAKLEKAAEKSRERTEEAGGQEQKPPVPSKLEHDHQHKHRHEHEHEPSSGSGPSRNGSKKTKRKKSCDLEKGIGLRI